jgi:hypothetical protein
MTIEFIAPMPSNVPLQLRVYRTRPPECDKNALILLGQAAWPSQGLSLPSFRALNNWLLADWRRARVGINRLSGAIRLNLQAVQSTKEPPRLWRIRDERAVELARSFADRARLLTPGKFNIKFNLARVTHLKSQTASVQGGVNPEIVLDAGVIFVREIDGVPVLGCGGYLLVNVAPNEEATGATRVWREIDREEGLERIVTPAHGIDELTRRLRLRGLQGDVQIIRADFCYFEAGSNVSQAYLEPSYAFVFKTRFKTLAYKSAEIIPATERPRQTWLPPRFQ